jgi:hypothetical protein
MAVTWFDIMAGGDGYAALVALAGDQGAEPSVREQALIALGDRSTRVALDIARRDPNDDTRRMAFHRAALRLAPRSLVELFPEFQGEALRQRIVEGVASGGDPVAIALLAAEIEREPDSSFRRVSLDRLARAAR